MILERIRVRRGARYLDQHEEAPGWALRIKRPINLESARDCVMGQVFGHYEFGMPRNVRRSAYYGLGITSSNWMTRNGFNHSFATSITRRRKKQIQRLVSLWEEEISRRKWDHLDQQRMDWTLDKQVTHV